MGCGSIQHFVFHDLAVLERQNMASLDNVGVSGYAREVNDAAGKPLLVWRAMF